MTAQGELQATTFDWADPSARKALSLSTRELAGAAIMRERAADDLAADGQHRLAGQCHAAATTYRKVLAAKQAGLLPALPCAPEDLPARSAA